MRRLIPLLFLLFAFPATASAASVTVGCAGLQGALDNADNDDITLLAGTLCEGTYYLPDRPLTLRGQNGAGFENAPEGQRSLTNSDTRCQTTNRARCRPPAKRRAFGNDQVVDNLIFKGTAGTKRRRAGTECLDEHPVGGGMYWTGTSKLTVSNSTFTDITSSDQGGGLEVDNPQGPNLNGEVALTNDAFTCNESFQSGGGAFISADTVTVGETAPGKSVYDSNIAGYNGGGLTLTVGNNNQDGRGTPLPAYEGSVTGTTFTANSAGAQGYVDTGGGGLWIGDRYTDQPSPERRGVNAEAARVSVGDNAYLGNDVGSGASEADFSDHYGGGAQFVGVDVHAFTTEVYDGNSVFSVNGDAEGGGFSVNASEFSTGAYAGENTVVVRNSVSKTTDSEGGGNEPATGAGIYIGGPVPGGTLSLVHATVVDNDASTQSIFDRPAARIAPIWGIGIQGSSSDTITIDRSIVYLNTLDGEAPLKQVAGTSDAPTVTFSDDPDTCPQQAAPRDPDAQGNICIEPKFAGGLPGAPVQAADSATVDALATTPITDDYLHKSRPSPAGGKADMGAHEIQVASPEPTVTVTATATATASPAPTVTPKPTATVKPTPTPDTTGVQGENAGGKKRTCTGRRFFPIKLRRLGYTFVKAKIVVNGKKVRTIRYKSGRLGARIDLRKFPRKTIRIKITATTSTGTVLKGKRVYHPCYRGKRPHTVPEL